VYTQFTGSIVPLLRTMAIEVSSCAKSTLYVLYVKICSYACVIIYPFATHLPLLHAITLEERSYVKVSSCVASWFMCVCHKLSICATPSLVAQGKALEVSLYVMALEVSLYVCCNFILLILAQGLSRLKKNSFSLLNVLRIHSMGWIPLVGWLKS